MVKAHAHTYCPCQNVSDRRLDGDPGCFGADDPELAGRMGQGSDGGPEEGRLLFGQRLSHRQAGGEGVCHYAEPGHDHGEVARDEVLREVPHAPGILAMPSGQGGPRDLHYHDSYG